MEEETLYYSLWADEEQQKELMMAESITDSVNPSQEEQDFKEAFGDGCESDLKPFYTERINSH